MSEESGHLSHHMLPIDESFKSTNCCTVTQREDVLCLDGGRAQVGVFLENDDLKGGRREDRRYGRGGNTRPSVLQSDMFWEVEEENTAGCT